MKEEKIIEEEIKKVPNKNNKINQGNFIILVIILSLISGLLGAALILKSNGSGATTDNGITTSTIKLNETNSISTAVG